MQIFSLDLKIQQFEHWYFKPDKHSDTSTVRTNLIEMSVNIFDYLSYEGDNYYLNPGEYEFPFKISLPNYLEPSFEFMDACGDVQFRYILYACLVSTDEKSHLSNINYIVVKKKEHKQSQTQNLQCCKNIFSWGMFDKGTAIFSASLNQNIFHFGEKFKLKYQIDNTRGKLTVKEMKITIMQKITMSWNFEGGLVNESKIFDKSVKLNSPPGDNFEGIFEDGIISNDSVHLGKKDMPYLHLMTDDFKIFEFQPSINSASVRCEYTIKLTLYFDSFVRFNSRPRIIIPIVIQHGESQMNEIEQQKNNNILFTEEEKVIIMNNVENYNHKNNDRFSLTEEEKVIIQKDDNNYNNIDINCCDGYDINFYQNEKK